MKTWKPKGVIDGVDPKAGGPRQDEFLDGLRVIIFWVKTVPSGESADARTHIVWANDTELTVVYS